MNNNLTLNKVINIVNNTEKIINKSFYVSNINNFLNKFAQNNKECIYLLYITFDNKQLSYMVTFDADANKTKISLFDKFDLIIYHSLIKQKTASERINDIVNNTNIILKIQNKNIDESQSADYIKYLNSIDNNQFLNNFFIKQFNTHLNKSIINEVTDYNQKNKINEQEGGILIKNYG